MVGKDGPKQRPVFMAIAEDCGHGRRGEARYLREPDGSESLFEVEIPDRWERDGKVHERRRTVKGKRLADDLPLIAAEFHRLKDEGAEA
jgi:type I restriction enzyme M protein